MAIPRGYVVLKGSTHPHPKGHKKLRATKGSQQITVTLVLRRRQGAEKLLELNDFSKSRAKPALVSRAQFASANGADPADIKQVEDFAKQFGLRVEATHPARRTVVLSGSVDAFNKAFALKLNDYSSARGSYRSHDGPVNVPAALSKIVKAVVGLTNREVDARRYSTARRQNPSDPPNTQPLTPQQVATLYNFPTGDGSGQTIGIYEMTTRDGPAGYTVQDISDTMQSFGGNLSVPQVIDVPVDGVSNSGKSDGETGLDITIASAIAQGAKIVVYFTGGTAQNIVHALGRMVHPNPGDPVPTILSISYGWGADDPSADSFSPSQYAALSDLFQDAANLSITVLVSSGDTGACVQNTTQAQTSYPATDPWVTACGGTTIGNINGASFDEFVWNDTGRAGPGATGGGVSARFPLPDYQKKAGVPKRIGTGKVGRGVPDIAGNASENSGYNQYINGQSGPVGGTSAVAPLYAGLIALINANLGYAVGFINPLLYNAGAALFRDILGTPGPASNSFAAVKGYPAGPGWDACTGWGSLKGAALQNALKAAGKPVQAIV